MDRRESGCELVRWLVVPLKLDLSNLSAALRPSSSTNAVIGPRRQMMPATDSQRTTDTHPPHEMLATHPEVLPRHQGPDSKSLLSIVFPPSTQTAIHNPSWKAAPSDPEECEMTSIVVAPLDCLSPPNVCLPSVVAPLSLRKL